VVLVAVVVIVVSESSTVSSVASVPELLHAIKEPAMQVIKKNFFMVIDL
jgi:hypothetical protein